MVKESEFKCEDPGFDPLAGQSEEQSFCPSESTLVQMFMFKFFLSLTLEFAFIKRNDFDIIFCAIVDC